jgi:hypothetical protein
MELTNREAIRRLQAFFEESPVSKVAHLAAAVLMDQRELNHIIRRVPLNPEEENLSDRLALNSKQVNDFLRNGPNAMLDVLHSKEE